MNLPFAFINEPLERADLLRRDPQRLDALRSSAYCFWLDAHGKVAIDAEGMPQIVRGVPEYAVFLGCTTSGEPWFAAQHAGAFAGHLAQTDLRQAALHWPAFWATLYAQARAVLHWQKSHRFCPACAQPLIYRHGGWQGDCSGCGRVEYPRSDPAVIVAVTDGERLLLGRQSGWPARRYSTLAGFVEPGETLEQAIIREVWEESRVHVLRSRYLASQPWPFPGSLMLGFIAHAQADMPQTGQDELEDARWFSRDQIQAAMVADADEAAPLRLSPPTSISRWLIGQWLAGERA
ncbi:NAD(+) diphosphatase [Lysobacteraceae bacterium NML07-0707]|nr:NAD(+) diphosphatase [Xanthomonadaceae bacterium NML07-0707]